MKIALIALLSTCVSSSIGSVVVAAPGQIQRPGEIAPPNVWVQNRSPNEAIPVTIVDAGQPLRFQMIGATPDGVLPTRAARQMWEYTQVRIGANQDATALLNTAGADGWETTGTQLSTAGGTVIVLKRPR
jgi:hypothetical protein